MIEIRFGESLEKSTRVFAAPTVEECNRKLSEMTKASKYTRQWIENDYTVIDYGSWSTFYFIGEAKEGGKMENNTLKTIGTSKYHIADLLDILIDKKVCIRHFEDYIDSNGDKDEMTFYDIIVGYTMVGEGKYLLHMVSGENVPTENDIRYNYITFHWLDDIFNDIGVAIAEDDQFWYEEGEGK